MLGTSQEINTRIYKLYYTATVDECPFGTELCFNRNIQNYFRKVRHYMFAYLQGCGGGVELEKEKNEKDLQITSKSYRK